MSIGVFRTIVTLLFSTTLISCGSDSSTDSSSNAVVTRYKLFFTGTDPDDGKYDLYEFDLDSMRVTIPKFVN